MLLAKLLLLPVAVASSVTVYVHSLPAPQDSSSPVPSPTPLAHIEYDAGTAIGSLSSYTPPTGSYSPEHLLRIGLTDKTSGHWRGVLTSAASFEEQYKKKFTIHVDENGEPYHIGLGTSARGAGDEVEVEVLKKTAGPQPALNKPIVLNEQGKIATEEPQKTFLQKYWWVVGLFVLIQIVAGGGDK
ncbi:hypothetical protein K491DRAFT_60552 [Lophiostoma macrostomum CBS 122681]|uniref:Cyclin-dependent protein kinase regulator pho80 n=1 Tax=Lophiostoma macrostomum CBS 122681 TaxID=1314788 RepID=A0A6A6TNK4_9PLEO|nr:hypothetical protein K491DRAFT_60552 [Lophiostoma macrostomum CBS 122681]